MPIKVAYLLILAYVTFFYYRRRGGAWTLNHFYLPVMLLVPFTFIVSITPAIPPLGFYSVALLTLYGAVLYHEKITFTLTLPDYIVLLLWVFHTLAGVFNTDVKYGLFIFQDMIIHTVFPYFMIRHMVPREKLLRFFVAFAAITTAIALMAPLEFVVNIRFPQLLQYFWPSQVLYPPFPRGGGYRVFSSFGHPIHAGMIFSMALMLVFILIRNPVFTQKKKLLWALILNALGIYMTVSRTSYFLVPPLLLVINMTFVKRKVSYFIMLVVGLVLVMGVAIPAMENLTKAGANPEADETATSVAYRAALMDNYYLEVLKKPIWGHGLDVPVVDGQWSIDNAYLLMMINNGIPALVIFAGLLIVVFLKGLLGYFLKAQEQEKALIWCLLVFLIYYSIVLGSVWLHNQPKIMLFSILGAIVSLTEVSKFKKVAVKPFQRVL